MKIAERIVMVMLIIILIGGAGWIYFAVKESQQSVIDAVARGEYEIPKEIKEPVVAQDEWRAIYPNTVPITIGDKTVQASVADTLSKRITGLSRTPFLPENVVKLFAFGVAGNHSIWMKDMNYPLDIIWVSEGGQIVHIEEDISPETYPDAFSSPTLAWYVIEANAGFVASSSIKLGDKVQISGN